MELPLGDTQASQLARQRLEHLGHVTGVDRASLIRLGRAFPNLASIYAADEAALARVVGDVTAARIRWFLDAPLPSGLLESPAPISNIASRAA